MREAGHEVAEAFAIPGRHNGLVSQLLFDLVEDPPLIEYTNAFSSAAALP